MCVLVALGPTDGSDVVVTVLPCFVFPRNGRYLSRMCPNTPVSTPGRKKAMPRTSPGAVPVNQTDLLGIGGRGARDFLKGTRTLTPKKGTKEMGAFPPRAKE